MMRGDGWNVLILSYYIAVFCFVAILLLFLLSMSCFAD
jgi:hypothetical protein